MAKIRLKYLIDALLFICIVGLAGIGFLQGFFLAEGPVADISKKYFLGLHTHQWGHLHFYISIAFAVLVIIHLILTWDWIKSCTKKIFKKGWRSALLGIVVLALLLPLILWLFSTKNAEKYAEFGTRSGKGRNIVVTEKQVTGESVIPKKKSQHLQKKEDEEQPAQQQVPVQEEEIFPKAESVLEGNQEHKEEPKLTRGRLDEHETGILITGQTSLRELEEKTGIPKSTILKEMGMPINIPSTETLGRLKRRYNFTMQELRDKIEILLKNAG
jgi:hypothetical protein